MAIRVGAIGLGGLAQTQLDILGDSDGVELVAGADIDPDARTAAEDAHGLTTYEDYERLLDEEPLDAALIVTPHTVHYEQARACLERGVHVHLEKPMVTRVDHGAELIELADESDLVLQIGYQRHFHPAYREIRDIVAEGDIGRVHMASCHLAQDWIIRQAGTWRTNPSLSGGGQLSDSGSHLLDVLLWTTDSEPSQVAAVMDDWDHDVDVNSALAATLEGPDGPITASIGISGDGTSFEEKLVIWGTEGHVKYAGDTVTVHKPTKTTHIEVGDDGNIREQKLASFVAAVRGDQPVAVPGEFGLRVTALTEAAYRAFEAAETIDVQSLVADARPAAD